MSDHITLYATEIAGIKTDDDGDQKIELIMNDSHITMLMEVFNIHQKTEGMTSAELFDLAVQAKIREIREGEFMDK